MSNYPKTLYRVPELAGQPFCPSNGTEGAIWMDSFCDQCIHECPKEDGKKCDLITQGMISNPPQEWRYSLEGYPICTKWFKWDWNNDGDPDDEDNPNYKGPPSNDPSQLLMPFDIWELLGVDQDVIVTESYITEKSVVQ